MELLLFILSILCAICILGLLADAGSHTFDKAGNAHSNSDDQTMFLGEKLKKEFDTLSLEESRRRLR